MIIEIERTFSPKTVLTGFFRNILSSASLDAQRKIEALNLTAF